MIAHFTTTAANRRHAAATNAGRWPATCRRMRWSVLQRVTAAVAVALWLASAGVALADLHVHFVDVDQGGAVLLQADGRTILVDAGSANGAARAYVAALGVDYLDLVVATHAHSDHIGGFTQILPDVRVGEVWYNGQTHTTRTFELFIDLLLSDESTRYREPTAGYSSRMGRLVIEVLHPATSATDYAGDLHDHNMALRVLYQPSTVSAGDRHTGVAFVLTGDLEIAGERAVLARGAHVAADVLQLGHHGSSTSTGAVFLRAVNPSVAVYQAGVDNRYGHPHDSVINRLRAAGITTMGTDRHGTIVFHTDGTTLAVRSEYPGAGSAPGPAAGTPSAAGTAAGGAAPAAGAASAATGCVNINRAHLAELQAIVHIGASRAQAIIDLRPFAAIGDLVRVPGIGEARLRDIIDQGVACVR